MTVPFSPTRTFHPSVVDGGTFVLIDDDWEFVTDAGVTENYVSISHAVADGGLVVKTRFDGVVEETRKCRNLNEASRVAMGFMNDFYEES